MPHHSMRLASWRWCAPSPSCVVMHPPLFKPHPKCEDVVQRLLACHEEKPYGKFFGACNEPKLALDMCFREEKEERRRANYDKSQMNARKQAQGQEQQSS